MFIISSTDYKYLGKEIQKSIKIGDIIQFDDFELDVQFIKNLENGNVAIGNFNYQLECKE